MLARDLPIIWMREEHGMFKGKHGVFGQHGLLTMTLSRSLTKVDHALFWALGVYLEFGL